MIWYPFSSGNLRKVIVKNFKQRNCWWKVKINNLHRFKNFFTVLNFLVEIKPKHFTKNKTQASKTWNSGNDTLSMSAIVSAMSHEFNKFQNLSKTTFKQNPSWSTLYVRVSKQIVYPPAVLLKISNFSHDI